MSQNEINFGNSDLSLRQNDFTAVNPVAESTKKSAETGKDADNVNSAFIAGGGELGVLMRALDWSRTSVGPVSQWSHALHNAVG